jgi:hypothetical protein
VISFSYWSIKLWFHTEGKLTVVLIIPSSWGFPTGPVRHHFLVWKERLLHLTIWTNSFCSRRHSRSSSLDLGQPAPPLSSLSLAGASRQRVPHEQSLESRICPSARFGVMTLGMSASPKLQERLQRRLSVTLFLAMLPCPERLIKRGCVADIFVSVRLSSLWQGLSSSSCPPW